MFMTKLLSIYIMHCVMVIRTAHCCVMGREIACRCESWPSTGQPKSRTKKHLFCEKKCVDRMTFMQCVRPADPTELSLLFCLKITFNT